MNKDEIIKIIKEKDYNGKIILEDIPEIDLYMDQVIQLFESKLSQAKRNEEDKVLTKTMINNYAKAKLLMSVKNKKYSKEHLILMSLIYELKGGLSISDIKLLLNNIVEKFENGEEYDLRTLYNKYLEITKDDSIFIKKNILDKINSIEEESYEEIFLLVTTMISMSNMYRKISEELIDRFFQKDKEGK
ncbi:MAG: DUF1836 domain-containing protein [Clostridiales bacterium]|nr:DUF1836 domain-containing protein [Clostridiales bacterium]